MNYILETGGGRLTTRVIQFPRPVCLKNGGGGKRGVRKKEIKSMSATKERD